MKKLFIIIAIAFVFVACQDKQVRHVQKVAYYYPESELPRIIYYYDVVGTDSTWVEEKWFHENGLLELEGKIVNNQREGEFRGYFPNGELMSVGSYVNGKREGKGKLYYDNGQVNIENEYCNDDPCGTWKKYDEYGNLVKEGNYKDVLSLFR